MLRMSASPYLESDQFVNLRLSFVQACGKVWTWLCALPFKTMIGGDPEVNTLRAIVFATPWIVVIH